jgi:cell division protein FtsB
VALVIVLAFVLSAYVRPMINLVDSWRDQRADAARHSTLKAENERLKGRLSDLSKPQVLEEEARRQGMVRQGERPYVIRDLEKPR